MSQNTLTRYLTAFPTYLPKPLRSVLFNSPLRPLIRKVYRRLLNRSDVTEVLALQAPLSGYKMRISLAVGKGLIYGTYEPALCEALRQHIQSGFACLDIGANIGYFTLLLSHYAGNTGRVHAFEPLPENYQVLNENVGLNQLTDRIICVPTALSNENSSAEFTYRNDMFTGGGSLVTENPWGDPATTQLIKTTVTLQTGDAYIQSLASHSKIDFIKLDVEGAEGLVLEGLQHTIVSDHPIILMEKHDCEGTTADKALALLSGWGYSLTWLDDLHVLAK